MKDMVNAPAHYRPGVYEVIKIAEYYGLDKDSYLFNVLKYILRAGVKDPDAELQDFKKAAWYLDRKIGRLDGSIASPNFEREKSSEITELPPETGFTQAELNRIKLSLFRSYTDGYDVAELMDKVDEMIQ